MTSAITWTSVVDYQDIRYEHSGTGIAKVTINRPRVHNAFRPLTVRELIDAFARIRDDSSIGCVLLTGEGEKAFCSGGDQAYKTLAGGYKDEDGIADGGVGALLTEAVRQREGSRSSRFVVRGVPTRFIPHAKPDVIDLPSKNGRFIDRGRRCGTRPHRERQNDAPLGAFKRLNVERKRRWRLLGGTSPFSGGTACASSFQCWSSPVSPGNPTIIDVRMAMPGTARRIFSSCRRKMSPRELAKTITATKAKVWARKCLEELICSGAVAK